MKIYLVLFQYCTDDCDGVDIWKLKVETSESIVRLGTSMTAA